MENKEEKKLRELIEHFYSGTRAEEVLRDIELGDEILGSSGVPEISERCVADIKAKIGKRLAVKRREELLYRRVYSFAGVAAVLAIMALVSVFFYQRLETGGKGPTVLSTMNWESEDLGGEDKVISSLTNKVDDVEFEFCGIQLDVINDGGSELSGSI